MLERMLSNVNRGQGMGFMLLGTNITTFTLQKFQKGLQALFVMVAPFLLSASACSSIAAFTPKGGAMSLISYLRHSSPQAELASLMLQFEDTKRRHTHTRAHAHAQRETGG